jgi:uncharacterized membrane protein
MTYVLLKTLHILSAMLLFGTGLGTAFHMWATHLRGDVQAIASTARNVVLADWLFTATSGVIQPVTGMAMIRMAHYDPLLSWLVATYILYIVAGVCWLLVVRLQMRTAVIAAECAKARSPLPAQYYRSMQAWFWLGWPAFISLIGVVWLMVDKPVLW